MNSEWRNLSVIAALFAVAVGIALASYVQKQPPQTGAVAISFDSPLEQLPNRIRPMEEELEEFPETTLTDGNLQVIDRIRNAVRMPFNESMLGACNETTTTVGFQRPEGYYELFSGRQESHAAVYEISETARSSEVLPCLIHLATIAASLHGVLDPEILKSVAGGQEFQTGYDRAMNGEQVNETWQCDPLEITLVSVAVDSEPKHRSIRIEFHSRVSNGE